MNVKLVLMTICVACLSGFVVYAGIVRNNEVYDDGNEEFYGVQIYEIERVCAMVGGMCVHKTDCTPGFLSSTSGLCPENKHLGVECCYKVKAPSTCRQALGECMEQCNGPKPPFPTDCPAGSECCILV